MNPLPASPLITKPWAHQRDGIAHAVRRKHALLAMGMGTGKSLAAIATACEIGASQIIVLCPASVIGVWRREFERHAPGGFRVQCIDDLSGTAEAKGRAVASHLSLCAARGDRAVVVCNYELAWRSGMGAVLLKQIWDLGIWDECFPAGTMVDSPNGPVAIESLRAGDTVYGVDHATGKIVSTEVRHNFHRMTNAPMTEIGGVRMTWNHPVWTAERGYVMAASVSSFDTVCINGSNDQMVRRLRERLPPMGRAVGLFGEVRHGVETNPSPLFVQAGALRDLCKGVSAVQAEHGILQQVLSQHGDDGAAWGQGEGGGRHARDDLPPGCEGEAGAASQRCDEPVSRSGGLGEGEAGQPSGWLQGPDDAQGWQWPRPDSSTGTSGRCAWMANGSAGLYGGDAETQAADLLQAGHCERGASDRRGSRWAQPQLADGARAGHEARCVADIHGLDDSAVQEQGNPGRSCSLHSEGVSVYNIETGTGNYFAGGLLVHNCHRLKSPGGKASRFVAELAKWCRRRLGLTGTPAPHSPLDLYAQGRAIDPAVWGRSFTAFRGRYAVMGGFQQHQVIGWQNAEELRRKFLDLAYEVRTEDAVELPETTDQTIDVKLSAKTLKLYGGIEDDFYAEVAGGSITVGNALVKLLRLQQLTSGFLTLDDGAVEEIDDAKRSALADLVEDAAADRPIVVFTRFVRDLDAIADVAAKAGRRYGEISGRRKDLTAEAGMPAGIDLMGVQIQSGGVGIDLTRASIGVYYSLGFNLGDYLQSRARLHRPGQHRHVGFFHLVAAKTVDVQVMYALQHRRDVIEAVLHARGWLSERLKGAA